MKTGIRDRLVNLNRQFYTEFASSFSATRQRLQPGVKRVLEGLSLTEIILDLGCGNGELVQFLSERGYRGQYTGVDFSDGLLDIAREQSRPGKDWRNGQQPIFLEVDISLPGWQTEIPSELKPFDCVFAFAFLHHLPGAELRKNVILSIKELLAPGGRFAHSQWQFLNSTRLRERIQPWSELGMDAGDLDNGDYLLDWRREGRGLRYVHHFTLEELNLLAVECGFTIVETFEADGEGGRLGLYQVWEITRREYNGKSPDVTLL